MTEFNQNLLNTIREKCLPLPLDHPIRRSSNVAFRDVFDPYCAEYHSIDNATRFAILQEMLEKGMITSVLLFYQCFMDIFAERRPDISNVAPDGMAFLLDYALTIPVVPDKVV